ncbi:hypothetical protein J31TS3_10850 [Paenibacillus lactis]|nr:hypothetical protein J31TS3_10850 [Paenibacillus lactis]
MGKRYNDPWVLWYNLGNIVRLYTFLSAFARVKYVNKLFSLERESGRRLFDAVYLPTNRTSDRKPGYDEEGVL